MKNILKKGVIKGLAGLALAVSTALSGCSKEEPQFVSSERLCVPVNVGSRLSKRYNGFDEVVTFEKVGEAYRATVQLANLHNRDVDLKDYNASPIIGYLWDNDRDGRIDFTRKEVLANYFDWGRNIKNRVEAKMKEVVSKNRGDSK